MYAMLGKVKCYEKNFYNPIFLYLLSTLANDPTHPLPHPYGAKWRKRGLVEGEGRVVFCFYLSS